MHFMETAAKAIHTVQQEGTKPVAFKHLLLSLMEIDLYFEHTHTHTHTQAHFETKVLQSNFTFTTK